MRVNARHPDYDASAAAWVRARDVIAGEDAVKAAGEKYLPKLDSQSADEYLAYKMRASFFNAAARTAEGFVGLLFRRDPAVRLPDRSAGVGAALAGSVDDLDLLGTSLAAYAKNVVQEVVSVGRCGTLVDWENEGEQRAYAALYPAEQILNWRTARVNGWNVPVLIGLRESVEVVGADDFDTKAMEQIRVLKLNQTGGGVGARVWAVDGVGCAGRHAAARGGIHGGADGLVCVGNRAGAVGVEPDRSGCGIARLSRSSGGAWNQN